MERLRTREVVLLGVLADAYADAGFVGGWLREEADATDAAREPAREAGLRDEAREGALLAPLTVLFALAPIPVSAMAAPSS